MTENTNNENSNQDELQRLVYGISHDLGAPLRSVVRFSEMLSSKLEDRLDEREKYWLELINTSGSRAQGMIDALLRYSRLHTQQAPPTQFELAELIQSVIQEQRFNFDNQDPIACCVNGNIQAFNGIFEHWQIFFTEIIKNAFLYHDKARKDSSKVLNIDINSQEQQHSIVITSTSLNVTDEQIPLLTRPYWRGYAESDFPGYGMGLSLCERIAHMHGGRLDFENINTGGLKVVYTYQTA